MSVEYHSKNNFLETREQDSYEKYDSRDIFPNFPKNALVELSNSCNHKCVFCANPRMNRGKGVLTLELYQQFVAEAVELGLKELGLYTTGEPFVIKNLNEYIKIAKDCGVEYIYITTNGALATESKIIEAIDCGLSSIKFSVNAGTRETYKLIHGKDDFDKVISLIKFISKYRKEKNIDIKLMASCVVTKFVEPEKEILKNILWPYVDDIAFYGVSSQNGQSLEQLSHLASSMTDEYPEVGAAPPCSMLWNRIHVTQEGYLTLCCIDYENALTYADLNKTTLKDAWENDIIVSMRKRHQTQKLDRTLCKNCLYGTDDKVFPISNHGHNLWSASTLALSSNRQKGTKSVLKRIDNLKNNSE
jgi:molybdenum cofactor biosynthesis enzyme MoaA